MEQTAEEAAEEARGRVEQLLREAHVYRLRQQWAAAESRCREALKLSPDDGMGLELLGDLLNENGSLDEALECYRRALAARPSRGDLEEKIARAVLRKDEEERDRLAAQLLLSSPVSRTEQKRNATVAILLSLMCPGAGQFFNRQPVKGGVLLGVWVVAIFLGWNDLFKFLLGMMGLLPRGEPVSDFLAGLGFLAVTVHLYGILDASAQAGRIKKPTGR